MQRIYEIDRLSCPRRRKVQLRIIAVIPNLDVVDRILRHLAHKGGADLFQLEGARAPPGA